MKRYAFTLVEMLVVMGIIGLLFALILPAVQHVRANADLTLCQNNMRQIGIALHNFHSDYGRLPPKPGDNYPFAFLTAKDPNTSLSWMALILPYVEQDALWKQTLQAFQRDSAVWHNPPHVANSTIVPLYVCPADSRLLTLLVPPVQAVPLSFASYLGVSGRPTYDRILPGVFGHSPGIRLTDIKDGTGNTIMAGERPPPDSLQAGQWYSVFTAGEMFGGPNIYMTVPGMQPSSFDYECIKVTGNYGPGKLDNPCDRFHFWSLHVGGSNFLFADTSVRKLPYTARDILPALATHSGGEVVEIP